MILQQKPHLTSPVRAAQIGYEAGKRIREYGAKPEHLFDNLEIERGEYERSVFYEAWEAAFRRGYLGQPFDGA